MKFFFQIAILILSLHFYSVLARAADQPPLPVLKIKPDTASSSVYRASKKPKVKPVYKKKKRNKPLRPLPVVIMPDKWNGRVDRAAGATKKTKPELNKSKAQHGLGANIAKQQRYLLVKKGQIVAVPLPLRKSLQTADFENQDKKSQDDIKPIKVALPVPPPLTKWDDKEILAARAQCKVLLAKVDVTVKPILPIRYNRCGAAAPLKVSAYSAIRGQRVSINPPATMNCELTARLAKWIETKLQPLALQHFSSRVKMIHNVASYSCRHRYNDNTKKLSEHALANALDIAGFTLENGDAISVLKHWPAEENGEKSAFLKAVHKSACSSFVVVLGPEANEAHKNHFHFDIGRYPVCQ